MFFEFISPEKVVFSEEASDRKINSNVFMSGFKSRFFKTPEDLNHLNQRFNEGLVGEQQKMKGESIQPSV